MPIDSTAAERELIRRIRLRDEEAWKDCISTYEGRLQAFVRSRLENSSNAEDLVQETFLGFLTALPNYDESTPLESFLFAIAAHKITDVLRRQGRRPLLSPLMREGDSSGEEPASPSRYISSLARSREERDRQGKVIANCLFSLIQQWFSHGEFERLKCAELLFVSGLTNKDAAASLRISEQDVANHKQFILTKLKAAAGEAW